jgi:hypothetical protein
MGDSMMSAIVTEESMTSEEIEAYYAGYAYHQALGDFKNYG